jgi:hypothetical protein
MKKILNIYFLIILILLFQSTAQAISLGTTTEGSYSEVLRDETAKFTILLWNSENISYPVKIRATQVPKGLILTIDPKELMLDYSKVTTFPAERGKHYVDTKQGIMKTTPINVLVKVPKNFDPGTYDVYVNIVAGKTTTGVSTFLEKNLKFTLNVITYRPRTTTSIKAGETPIGIEKITGAFSGAFSGLYAVLIVLLVIAILFVIWRIFKHE